jgi:hypothetical protein
MITDIPGSADFSRSSVNLLHLGWTVAYDVLGELDEADLPSWDDDGSVASHYLEMAQPELANALALLMQSQEMGLKGRIAAVSPYLLIGRDPRDWPRKCDTSDVAFADFRSADAADLIRIHDTVSENRLPLGFVKLFEATRRRRNIAVHTVSKAPRITPSEIFLNVLLIAQHLHPHIHWPSERLRYLSDSPLSVAWSHDFSYQRVLKEMDLCVRTLDSSQCIQLLGFDKELPAFFCPYCDDIGCEIYEFPRFAQLDEELHTSTTLRCFICRQQSRIVRRPCLNPECIYGVLLNHKNDDGEFRCLECNEDTDPAEAEARTRLQ